ncbi:hypothetical protein KBC31_00055 [Candidatus Saccharibacteria bacterium]|nr:hypothetical protein [Candidatus Saccharibacteria bacterium]
MVGAVALSIDIDSDRKKQLFSSQLRLFCDDNNYAHSESDRIFSSSGSLFQTHPESSEVEHVISGIVGNNQFRVFNFLVKPIDHKSTAVVKFGVAEITLPKRFPHIILDNKLNPAVNGGHTKNSQRLNLGEAFDSQFVAYGPSEYEIEVLQVLTPELISQLSNSRYAIDFEFIGNHLYLYSNEINSKKSVWKMFSAISMINTATLGKQKTFKMVDNIGTYEPVLQKPKWGTVETIKTIFNLATIATIIWFLFFLFFL